MTKAYWFEDKDTGKTRRTPSLGSSLEDAKSRLKRPAKDKAKVKRSRTLTPEEEKRARRGDWVKGAESKGDNRSGRGFGPKPKQKKLPPGMKI